MNKLGMNLLKATRAKVEGEIAITEANLQVLLQNPVGIGEHIDLAADVYCLVDTITAKSDMLNKINEIISDNSSGGCIG